jgi:hypothetical protein
MKLLIIGLISLVGFAIASRAGSLTFNPIADAFVSAANPTSNYGGAGALAISASDSTNGEFDSVMQFNLSSEAGLNISSITLQFTAASPNNPIFNASAAGQFSIVWMQDDSWTEGTGMPNSPGSTGITFDTLPDYLGSSDETLGTYSFSGATSGANTYTLSLGSGFLADVEAGDDVSFELLPADNNVSYLLNSRSFPTTTSRPLLTVTTVPEPGNGLLVLAGFLVIAFCGRRQLRKV